MYKEEACTRRADAKVGCTLLPLSKKWDDAALD